MPGFYTGGGGGATPAEVWGYPTRTLTQAKFQFWSAIITQQRGAVSLPAGSGGSVIIQPPPGETWWVEISMTADHWNKVTDMSYGDFDGTTTRFHAWSVINPGYQNIRPLIISRVLTSSLYAYLGWYNPDTVAHTGFYGYSGFKLSHPQWAPKRLEPAPAKPFKMKADLPLPDPIKPLGRYKTMIYGLDPARPGEYVLAVILEEDTPLAVDENTGFTVERKSVYVLADVLADLITKFRTGALDYVKAGYEPYLRKWKAGGIDLGVV